MDTSQHDESADTGSSRPADPDVVARESGKVTPERSSENPRQRPPLSRAIADSRPTTSRQNISPPAICSSAPRHRAFLVELGIPKKYLKRTDRWPSAYRRRRRKNHRRRRLIHHADKLARLTCRLTRCRPARNEPRDKQTPNSGA
jgi:hypothetical protein